MSLPDADAALENAGFLSGGGIMGAMMRAHDWSTSPLGAPLTWPQSLRSVVGLLLGSKFPMFVAWGSELGFLYNDSYQEILGAKHPHALGARFRDIWGEIWPDISPLIDAAMSGVATYRENLPLIMNRKGFDEQTYFTFSYSPVRDESGQVAGMFCACTETTAQVLSARRTADERERLRRMFEQAPGMIAMFRGPEHVFEIANDKYMELVGQRDIIGKPIREALPEIAAQGFADLLDNVFRSGEPYIGAAVPVQIEREPGGPLVERLVDFIYQPMTDDGGRISGIFVQANDVSARREAEKRLRDSEERYRQIVEGAEEFAIFSIDETGIIKSWNTGAERMTGYSEADAIGQPGAIIFTPEDRAAGVPEGEMLRAKQEARAANERWHLRKDGTRFWGSGLTMRLDAAGGGFLKIFRDRTADHEAEAALIDSENRFRALVEVAAQMVWRTDAAGRIIEDSPGWRAFTGQRIDEWLGWGWLDAVHPEDRRHAAASWSKTVESGEPYDDEFRLRHAPSGEWRTTRVRATPLRGADGEIVSWVGMNTDITAQRKAEARLRELNETLEAQVAERTAERDRIWNLPRELMCVARLDGTFISVNPAWERVLGWPVDWLTGRNAAEIKHPEDAQRTQLELANLAAGTPTHGFEDRYRHKDGGWRWISWTIEPEADLIYCVGRDVTAEKEARDALEAAENARREADALYRAYFANTGEALFVVRVLPDEGFSLEELNPAHERATGLRTIDLLGKRIEDQLPPELVAPVTQNYRRAVEAGRPIGYREALDLPTGPRYWDTVLVPVRDKNDVITRLVGSSRDVTGQVQAEEALRQAQKMEAVGQLTGGIAHDFNNLLGAVVGSLDLIRRKPNEVERVKQYAEAGLKAAERGAKLTGQLLAFSRAQRLEQKPVALSSLVSNMRDMLDRSLGPLVRLTLDLDCDGAVLSDPTQLEMALLNLAINARDAMPEGGELTIATASRSIQRDAELRPGEYVEVSVSDTGSGMPPEVAARAFDPFFTTKGVGKGTGLGLSQVYGVARQTGGTVRIESRPGHGTSVRILLPKTSLPVQLDGDAGANEIGAGVSAAMILVVDDDPDVRRVLVDSLEALGYSVAEAENGPEGLAILEQSAPDVMMVDFAMPGMNGAEVARAARERRPDLPIIFATGYSDTAAIEGVAGRDAIVLRKPFRVDDLQAVLAHALDSAASVVN